MVAPKDQALDASSRKTPVSAAQARKVTEGSKVGGLQYASSNMTSRRQLCLKTTETSKLLKQSLKDIPQQYVIMSDRIEGESRVARRFIVKNVSFHENPPSVSQDDKIILGRSLASTRHCVPKPIWQMKWGSKNKCR